MPVAERRSVCTGVGQVTTMTRQSNLVMMLSIATAIAGGVLVGGCVPEGAETERSTDAADRESAAELMALTPCGDAMCEGDEFCCNESCSICAPVVGGSCTMQLCDQEPDLGEECGERVCPFGQVCCSDACGICAVDQDACPATPCLPLDLLPCGDSHCGVGEFCCNESCGVCAPIGGSCTLQLCNPDAQFGERCGDTICDLGMICCDAACGVCAKGEDACPSVSCPPEARPEAIEVLPPTLAAP